MVNKLSISFGFSALQRQGQFTAHDRRPTIVEENRGLNDRLPIKIYEGA
jgi:hypothetical protein